MLGWEFPPVFAGGLGVACYNIVKSLSPSVNINLILPFAESSVRVTDNFNVIGLNQPGKEVGETRLEAEELELLSEIHRISVKLSAYPSYTITDSHLHTSTLFHNQNKTATWNDVSTHFFQTRNLYGSDINHRIMLFAKAAKQIASKIDFEIIHAHDWPTFKAGMEIKKASNKPLVLHIHALETDRAGLETRNSIYYLEKDTMLNADKIIAVSEYTKQQIISHYNIPDNKIVVAHNGAEKTEPSTFIKSVKEKWVTFVGRITFQKGPGFILETAVKLIKVLPNVRFVVAGEGDMLPSLLHEVARQRLGRYFIFTGFLSRAKINQLLACSDAYFMPSVSEPFGLSALEAVQQGAASVISNRSGCAEVLTHSLQADFWDTDKFANYLYALLQYPKLKNTMTSESLRDIQNLTWSSTADKILNVYHELINN